MHSKIDADALDAAVARALVTAIDDNGVDCSAAMLVGSLVSRTFDFDDESKSELDWWRPAQAVIRPLLELTAAVIENPLGDNSAAAAEAVQKMMDELRTTHRD
jgi:hypothetical protein